MDLDDDFFILDREKAENTRKRNKDVPLSSFSGDESVASHFALVTAYEDIKKRLKESEKENSFLKKRVRLLEDQLIGKSLGEETNTIGREQVNKAYHAYREICIERDNLKNQLDKVVKENLDSLRALNEQLQSKEVELLQLKTELETQQVMSNLNSTPTDWEVTELNSKLKVRGLEQEMELLRDECLRLRSQGRSAKQQDQIPDDCQHGHDQSMDGTTQSDMRQALWELKKEMSNLHLVTEVQAEVLRKVKARDAAAKKATTSAPVQCMEDLETGHTRLRLTSSGAEYKKHDYFLHAEDGPACWASGDPITPYPRVPGARTEERPIPVGGPAYQENDFSVKGSFDENSWVFSGSPKPSDSTFWEAKSNVSPPSPYFLRK
ncbi:5-azacytidine-induced protein 2 [Lissotriton helveticus]